MSWGPDAAFRFMETVLFSGHKGFVVKYRPGTSRDQDRYGVTWPLPDGSWTTDVLWVHELKPDPDYRARPDPGSNLDIVNAVHRASGHSDHYLSSPIHSLIPFLEALSRVRADESSMILRDVKQFAITEGWDQNQGVGTLYEFLVSVRNRPAKMFEPFYRLAKSFGYAGDVTQEDVLEWFTARLGEHKGMSINGEIKILNDLIQIAIGHGWNGVENPKILTVFLESELDELARLRNQGPEPELRPRFQIGDEVVVLGRHGRVIEISINRETRSVEYRMYWKISGPAEYFGRMVPESAIEPDPDGPKEYLNGLKKIASQFGWGEEPGILPLHEFLHAKLDRLRDLEADRDDKSKPPALEAGQDQTATRVQGNLDLARHIQRVRDNLVEARRFQEQREYVRASIDVSLLDLAQVARDLEAREEVRG